jgi:hypothetical protein
MHIHMCSACNRAQVLNLQPYVIQMLSLQPYVIQMLSLQPYGIQVPLFGSTRYEVGKERPDSVSFTEQARPNPRP